MDYKIAPYNVQFTGTFTRTTTLKMADRTAKELLRRSDNSDSVEFALKYLNAKRMLKESNNAKEIRVPERYAEYPGIFVLDEFHWRSNYGLFHCPDGIPKELPKRKDLSYSIMNDVIQAAQEYLH